MSRITRLDVPSVDRALANFDSVADRFAEAVEKMRHAAADLDGCWGDDEFGRKFAEHHGVGYVPYAAQVLDNSDAIATTLRDIHDNLRKIVGWFQELDTESGEVLELIDG